MLLYAVLSTYYVNVFQCQLNMNIFLQFCILLKLSFLGWVTGLDGSSYGTGPDLSKVGQGYKAAYAQAREMRNMQFGNKSSEGPREQALLETYQVTGTCLQIFIL